MKIFRLVLFFFIVLYCTFNLCAQSSNQRVEKAYAVFNAGEYAIAEALLKEAYERVNTDEEKNRIVFMIAECYRRTNQPKKAELWYSKAIKRGFKDPLAILYYADAMKMNEKYVDALEQYQEYKRLVPDDVRADNGIHACEMAKEWMDNPTGYIVEEAYFFNSRYNDYSPAYGRDDYMIMFFTSSREDATGDKRHGATGQKFEDIYESKKDNKGKWSVPVKLGENVNTEASEGTPIMDGSYETLYFTRCEKSKNKKQGCQICVSSREDEGWSKAKVLEIAKDTSIVAHPAISKDGNTLYFASDMPGGFGGMDIWMIQKTGQTWSAPINMGDRINTKANEMFPFVHKDGTLYFSSNGHIGLGGLDIFKAELIAGTQWKVTNMGYPINSSKDDFGIIFEDNTERGFFSSSRGLKDDDNIYAFFLPAIKFNLAGKVLDEKTLKPLAAAEVKAIGSDGFTMLSKTDAEGNFRFMLKPETDYIFIASAEGYLKGKGKESTKGISESKDFGIRITLASIAKPIELPNIFYDFGKWDLRQESMASLDKLVETLNDNPNITIELMSHTDNRGSEQANLELSQKRAQAVVDYLIQKGIAADRLVAKGYGEIDPKVIDEKIHQQVPFFELNVRLTEDYINTLPSEDYQEIAHQINRRTEFRVLSTNYKPKRQDR